MTEPTVGQPTTLSVPLMLPSPDLGNCMPPCRILPIPPPALLDEFLIEIHAIGQDHIGKGADVLVVTICLERG